jgi:hypothetical protein
MILHAHSLHNMDTYLRYTQDQPLRAKSTPIVTLYCDEKIPWTYCLMMDVLPVPCSPTTRNLNKYSRPLSDVYNTHDWDDKIKFVADSSSQERQRTASPLPTISRCGLWCVRGGVWCVSVENAKAVVRRIAAFPVRSDESEHTKQLKPNKTLL